jgi:hypothetical protein
MRRNGLSLALSINSPTGQAHPHPTQPNVSDPACRSRHLVQQFAAQVVEPYLREQPLRQRANGNCRPMPQETRASYITAVNVASSFAPKE